MGCLSLPLCWPSSSSMTSCFLTTPLLPLPSAFPRLHLSFSVLIVQRNNLNHSGSSLNFSRNKRGKVFSSQLEVEDVTDEEACELVSGAELSIGEGIDTIGAYLCKAVKNNNGTGILLLSDIFGFEDSATRDFAYRVACNGYNVLVPDLFRGDPWTKERPRELFEEWYGSQFSERVVQDIFTSADWMVNEFLAAGISKKLGIIGFCFGGGQVINILSQDKSAIFGTGVSFYGTRMNVSVATNVIVPVLLISGDNDPLCPIDELKVVEKEIKGSKMVVFEGRGHGFAHRPESLEEDEDAEEAFAIMRSWLQDGLHVDTTDYSLLAF